MRVLGIVPARAGSKRLPGKNSLKLGGKPLWEIALDQALSAGLFPVVSTDDPEIYKREPLSIERPAELAGDGTPVEDVVAHVLECGDVAQYDAFVLLNPTHPLRKVEDIKLCVAALEGFPSCTAVRKDWGYTIDEGVRFSCLNEQTRVPRLVVTGSIYAVRVPAFLEKRKLMITGNITRGTYHIEVGPHVDINTYDDYLCAKALWESRKDPLKTVFA